MLHIPPTKVLISTNRSNKTKRQEPHKRAYLSENGGLDKKRSGEWAKSNKKKDKTEREAGLGRRTREELYCLFVSLLNV